MAVAVKCTKSCGEAGRAGLLLGSLRRARTVARTSCLILALATSLQAQERGRRGGDRGRSSEGQGAANAEPKNWASGGVGYFALAQVADGTSHALWDFGGGFPITFSLERVLAQGITAGVAGSYTHAPLLYAGTTTNGGCTSCNAHSTVATYGVVFHSGGSATRSGLYQVFRLFLGAIQYGAFEQDALKKTLPPDGANIDFLFSAGYGFGYSIARDWRVELTGESMYSIHERDRLPGNAQTLARHYLIGLGLRVGF